MHRAQAANIIFIEQPAGVGFSYPNIPANDTTTAVDTDAALRHFLSMHPELQGRPFYVMGESYGGHYVPNTVKQIQTTNAAVPAAEQINIKVQCVCVCVCVWQLWCRDGVGRRNQPHSTQILDTQPSALIPHACPLCRDLQWEMGTLTGNLVLASHTNSQTHTCACTYTHT